MNYYTTSTFREVLADLVKKPREGYATVVADICSTLQSMPDNLLRDTNERIIQMPTFRIVKLRVANSGQKLSKANGFRLIYMVSLKKDELILLRVFPKRGAKGMDNISNAEYMRLLSELERENQANSLYKVDINNSLAILSNTAKLA